MTLSQFIHSTVGGHFKLFLVCSYFEFAGKHVLIYVFWYISSLFLWDKYPEMELLLTRSWDCLLFSFMRYCLAFSKTGVVVHILTSDIGEFLLLYIFFNTCYCQT